jgi:CpcD/allophycocyanin linker domain
MTIISVASTLSDYSSRPVTVTVKRGLHHQGLKQGLKKGITIPYSSLSQTIQSIHRFGGSIIDITVSSFHLAPFMPTISSESAIGEVLDLESELKSSPNPSTPDTLEISGEISEIPVQPLAPTPAKPPTSNRGKSNPNSNQGKKSRRPNK